VRLPSPPKGQRPRAQLLRRFDARLRAFLGPAVARLTEATPVEARVRRSRARLGERRTRLEAQRSELARLETALRDSGREQGAARREFLKAAASFTPYVVAEADGTRYVVSTHDSFSAQLFVKQQRREIRMLARVQRALEQTAADRGRRVLLEVGANIGTGAVEAIHRHGYDHVVAFEPEPENFKLLRMNAILNGVEDRISMRQEAVSDAEGVAVLQVSSRNSGAHTLSGAEVAAVGTVQVPTVSVDGMAESGEIDPDSVSLLWMDIEGYEVHALMGARSLVERAVPFVMELNPPVLRAAGRADELLPTLSAHYSHVIDLRDFGKNISRDAFRPLETVPRLIEDADAKAMDVLVCRLP
jgi:FkbM family methyltransferase